MIHYPLLHGPRLTTSPEDPGGLLGNAAKWDLLPYRWENRVPKIKILTLKVMVLVLAVFFVGYYIAGKHQEFKDDVLKFRKYELLKQERIEIVEALGGKAKVEAEFVRLKREEEKKAVGIEKYQFERADGTIVFGFKNRDFIEPAEEISDINCSISYVEFAQKFAETDTTQTSYPWKLTIMGTKADQPIIEEQSKDEVIQFLKMGPPFI